MPLITFEGIDGSGKTTVIERISKVLTDRFIPCFRTSEPYKYRDLILNKETKYPFEELALWLADRNAHVKEIIKPILTKNPYTVILCDRFTDSTLAYQNVITGIDLRALNSLNAIFAENIFTDRVYYLDVDIQKARARIKQDNLYDFKPYEFYFNVKSSYQHAFEHRPEVVSIDANKPLDNVVKNILIDLDEYLKNVLNTAKSK